MPLVPEGFAVGPVGTLWAAELLEKLKEVVGGAGVLVGPEEVETLLGAEELMVEIEDVKAGTGDEPVETMAALAEMKEVRVIKFSGMLQDGSGAIGEKENKTRQ